MAYDLQLSVTKTWSMKAEHPRALSCTSYEWRTLRKKVLDRDNNTCRFCGFRATKYMVCDHVNGRADNNDMSNLGINCKLCDAVRHCGLAGIYNTLELFESDMKQVDIIHATYEFFKKHLRVPEAHEIDKNAKRANENMIQFANKLLVDDPTADTNKYKGFFSVNANGMLTTMYNKMC